MPDDSRTASIPSSGQSAAARSAETRAASHRHAVWDKIAAAIGFLAAAGLLALPVTAFVDWLRQEEPPIITELTCEIAEPATAQQRLPPLDRTEPITVGVGENLLCAVDQEGGDYIVWRGGGNGFAMRSGPVRDAQRVGWLESLRLLIEPPARPQITACAAQAKPIADQPRLPDCRHEIAYTAPGNHVLSVRLSKRGSSHVEELALPIRVVEAQTVLQLDSIDIVPPGHLREAKRVGSLAETLDAPTGLFSPAREETRRVTVIEARPGETIVPGSERLRVKSSNGASASLEVTASAVTAVVNLRSGSGFNQRRAWLVADVTATARSDVSLPEIALGPITLRAPGRRLVYSQPVPEHATVRFQYAGGQRQEVALGSWNTSGPKGTRVRFIRTEGGLVAEGGVTP